MNQFEQDVVKFLKGITPGTSVNVSEEYKQKYPTFMEIAKRYMLEDWTIQFNNNESKIIKLCQQFIDSINAESNTRQSVLSFVSEFEFECED